MEPLNNEIVCPIDAEWKFKKSDLITLKSSQRLKGKYFYACNIPGVSYNVEIFRLGPVDNILFYVNGSKERKVTANLIPFIESANYTREVTDDFQKYEFLSLYDAKTVELFESKNKFFVNGELTVRVKGTLKAARSKNTKISVPISMQWRIKEDDLKANIGSNDGYLRSERVWVSSFYNVKYYLSIYPKTVYTSEDGEKTYAEVKLIVELGGEEKIEAVYDFSVDSANFKDSCRCNSDKSVSITFGSGCHITDDIFDPAKGYIVDGFMTVNIQGVLVVEKRQYTTLNCKKGFATKAAHNKKDKDFSIVVGEKIIKVHKKVMMDASPVLTAMLGSGLKETTENKLDIKDFSFEVVDAAIKLCYSCGVPRKFTTDDLLSLYQFAEKYEIKLIMDLVENYLVNKKICTENVCQLVRFSKTFSATKLYQSSIDFLLQCSKESTPVSGLDILDNDLLAMLFKNTFLSVVNTDTDI
uniref:BTB domain-containing protein n=1 Tax=Panagrolaimus sp. ES5 TaxID=591445 RepID=A0AC34F752_9BILA